jgi:hypothetical protein
LAFAEGGLPLREPPVDAVQAAADRALRAVCGRWVAARAGGQCAAGASERVVGERASGWWVSERASKWPEVLSPSWRGSRRPRSPAPASPARAAPCPTLHRPPPRRHRRRPPARLHPGRASARGAGRPGTAAAAARSRRAAQPRTAGPGSGSAGAPAPPPPRSAPRCASRTRRPPRRRRRRPPPPPRRRETRRAAGRGRGRGRSAGTRRGAWPPRPAATWARAGSRPPAAWLQAAATTGRGGRQVVRSGGRRCHSLVGSTLSPQPSVHNPVASTPYRFTARTFCSSSAQPA